MSAWIHDGDPVGLMQVNSNIAKFKVHCMNCSKSIIDAHLCVTLYISVLIVNTGGPPVKRFLTTKDQTIFLGQ